MPSQFVYLSGHFGPVGFKIRRFRRLGGRIGSPSPPLVRCPTRDERFAIRDRVCRRLQNSSLKKSRRADSNLKDPAASGTSALPPLLAGQLWGSGISGRLVRPSDNSACRTESQACHSSSAPAAACWGDSFENLDCAAIWTRIATLGLSPGFRCFPFVLINLASSQWRRAEFRFHGANILYGLLQFCAL